MAHQQSKTHGRYNHHLPGLLLVWMGAAHAAAPGISLPAMPPEAPSPAEQKARKQADRTPADQRAAAQRRAAEKARDDNAAAERQERERGEAEAKRKAEEAERAKQRAEAEKKRLAEEAAERERQRIEDEKKRFAAQFPTFGKLPSRPGGPTFIVLPQQGFTMGNAASGGSAHEKPTHPVQVTQPIAMGEMEVTTAQYMACVRAGKCAQPAWNDPNSSYFIGDGENRRVDWDQPARNVETYKNWRRPGEDARYYARLVSDSQPIVGVSWHNAVQYAQWLSAETQHRYRLPTEAEWEYACRAGQSHEYCGSNKVEDVAWFYDNSGSTTHPGGQKAANAWGLRDMSGNVREWVQDCYSDKEYDRRQKTNAPWPAHQPSPETGNCSRVLRGGSWFIDTGYLRAAFRSISSPDFRFYNHGFRLLRTLP